MTRKFYFKPHPHRGHHLDIHKNLDMIKKKVEKLQNGTKPKKKSDSIKDKFYNFRKSFKLKKSPEKPSQEAIAGPSTRKPPTMTDTSKSRKPSTSKSPERKSSTGRLSNASEKDVSKPAWR